MRTPEQEAVLRSILKLMDFWNIRPEELGTKLAKASHKPVLKDQTPEVAPAIKYRHPVSHETWDGKGPQPDWLRRALTVEGYTVDNLKPPNHLTES